MKIAIVGKFKRLHDEEYIARSFEQLGHQVMRIEQSKHWFDMKGMLERFHPEMLLYTKWNRPVQLAPTIGLLRREGCKTVCWLFDLYFGYARENQVRVQPFFQSDYVFTTDGGHNPDFVNAGVNHQCVRQGIVKEECYVDQNLSHDYDVIFVGSENPYYTERTKLMYELRERYNFEWFGRKDTNEVRNIELNQLYSRAKIVIGDSYYSPHYWSNRIAETLGRGGFLIHQDVPGLREEYPDLVTYKKGDIKDLYEKIDYYLSHEDERQEIIRKNFELVRDRYTMDKKCEELLQWLNK